MVEFDYSNLPKREHKDCQDCGQQFVGFDKDTLCIECLHIKQHPEKAPKHWIWTKTGRRWTIIATWPDTEPLPTVGDTVSVHRKDGTNSAEVITEVDGRIYDMNGRARLHCWVR